MTHHFLIGNKVCKKYINKTFKIFNCHTDIEWRDNYE